MPTSLEKETEQKKLSPCPFILSLRIEFVRSLQSASFTHSFYLPSISPSLYHFYRKIHGWFFCVNHKQ